MTATEPDQRPNRTIPTTVAAFVCGVLTLTLSWVPLIGVLSLPLGIAALALAHIGRRHVRDFTVGGQPVASRGLVAVGTATAIAGLIVGLFTLVTFLRGFQGPAWREDRDQLIDRFDLGEQGER